MLLFLTLPSGKLSFLSVENFRFRKVCLFPASSKISVCAAPPRPSANREFKLRVSGQWQTSGPNSVAEFSSSLIVSYFLSYIKRIIGYCTFLPCSVKFVFAPAFVVETTRSLNCLISHLLQNPLYIFTFCFTDVTRDFITSSTLAAFQPNINGKSWLYTSSLCHLYRDL